MEKINSVTELKNAIYVRENELAVKKMFLFQQFDLTLESLKPINILKNTLKEVSSKPFLIERILGAAIGITSGYFSRKIVVGKSVNVFRKLFGSTIQLGITHIIANNSVTLKTIGQYFFRRKNHVKEPIN